MTRRVGIFSGTFDPIHNGHVRFAQEAIKQCKLDKVFFLVEPRPRRKQGVRAFEHRVNMVKLALEQEPQLGVIVLEQQRFTPHETLPVLQARFKGAELIMLIGEDMLTHMASWPHIDELITGISFVVGVRENTTDVQHHIRTIEKTRGVTFRYDMFKTDLSGESSSKVRAKIRRGQTPGGLHLDVLTYIQLNGLYASAEDDS